MKLRFGPAGNSDAFYDQGYKHSYQMPEWLYNMGLDAYEYSFGRGVRLSTEAALKIREQAEKYDIAVSVHAPYFINLANPDPEKLKGSYQYLLDSVLKAEELGARRVIVHVGSDKGEVHEIAVARCAANLKAMMADLPLGEHIILCPETMGKKAQIGTLDEILSICEMDERLLPTIDFAHLHAIGQGCLQTEEDFAALLDRTEAVLGVERARRIHIHFSPIEYTAAGEKRHRTMAEGGYGPYFQHLAGQLAKRKYCGRVICESSGTMANDAAAMKKMYDGYNLA